MNTENAEFLKNSLLNLGFGDKLNAELEKQIAAKATEFKLGLSHEFDKKTVDYTLHFKAGENQDRYFFNKYDASIRNGDNPAKDVSQTFYINKGNGITAKEAFNLLEGRSVHKQLTNLENQKYHAWLKLDDQNVTESGNKKIKQYHQNYGFDIEKVITGIGIREMDDPKAKDSLLYSLRKGNIQQINVKEDGQDFKYFIAANPQFKTVDLYNDQMKKIKREVLLEPEIKLNERLQKSGKNVDLRSEGETQPKIKQSRKSKLKV